MTIENSAADDQTALRKAAAGLIIEMKRLILDQQNLGAVTGCFVQGLATQNVADILESDWEILSQLLPEARFLVASYFRPDSSLLFLRELVRTGTDKKDILTMSNRCLMGVNRKTHLNILGRIKAGQTHIETEQSSIKIQTAYGASRIVEPEQIKEAVHRLVEFERKLTALIEAHRPYILSALGQRTAASPKLHQMAPEKLWSPNDHELVPSDYIDHSWFGEVGRHMCQTYSRTKGFKSDVVKICVATPNRFIRAARIGAAAFSRYVFG